MSNVNCSTGLESPKVGRMNRKIESPHLPHVRIQSLLFVFLSITILIFVITPSFDFLITQSPDEATLEQENNNLQINSDPSSRSNGGSGSVWHFTEELEYTMDINKASDSYIRISPKATVGNRLSLRPELNPNEFLSNKAISAIQQSPDWLKRNLTEKFIDLSQIRLDLGNEANAAFGDLDSDGDLDMLCGSQDNKLRYFENCGTVYEQFNVEDQTLFEHTFLDEDLICADPEFGDLDADSDLDIIIGNQNGDIIILINNGDRYNPRYNDVTTTMNVLDGYTSPCLGDLDGDNDLDVLCGAQDGRIYYFENSGTAQEYTYNFAIPQYQIIDVGTRSKPVLEDLDGDGDLDLTIGDDQAILNYYENIGTPENPNWRYDSTVYLGLILAAQTSPYLADLNGDGRYDLVVGCSHGQLYYIENIGTSTEPQWQIWSTYKVFPGIEYYDPVQYIKYVDLDLLDSFATLIINAEENLKDEIAFSIGHTATQILQNPSTTPELYKRNAELLYEIDQYIDYAEIIDHGTIDDPDYYSTVKYKYKEKNSSIIQTIELPRDIYYWYVVHPKITDEMPLYINPETGEPVPPPIGQFWRDYLFYHNDTKYPPDPPTDPNDDGIPNFHYPKEESPPLLKEKISGIKYLYDDQPYDAPRGYDNQGYNNTRPWGYKDHAIEAVSNWVAKTLPLNEQESADGERPIQPVRIAHHHNGNCGELQDLTIAAARTALIPAAGILLLAEDHVWNEFYHRGWHQWDNYWSDGGSVVDNFMNYWVGWNQRGGSGLTKWRGDDAVSDVTQYYVPEEDLSTITIYVRDRNGYPVDGARVMVGSHWLTDQASGYQVTMPYPSIWNYTDTNGSCIFKVATQEGLPEGNKNFSFKVISKLGNDEQPKTQLVHGMDYEFWFALEGRKPERELEYRIPSAVEPPHRFMVMLYFKELESHQQPPNPMVGSYHPQLVTKGREIEFYLFNESNFGYYCRCCYKSDEPVLCIPVDNNYGGLEVLSAYELLDNDDWYLVGYNKNTIETSKKVWVKLLLYEQYDELPVVSILTPQNGQSFQVGEQVTFSGQAYDDRGIKELTLRIEGNTIDITEYLVDKNWTYTWDTSGYSPGNYTIYVFVYDTNNNGIGIPVKIILTPAPLPDTLKPVIIIESPTNGSAFIIGSKVKFNGFAYDEGIEGDYSDVVNAGLKSLTLTLESKQINLIPYLKDTTWTYTWDSTDKLEGEYNFKVQGTDEAGNIQRALGNFELIKEYVDKEPPIINLESPKPGDGFGLGTKVVIRGTVKDDIGVTKLEINYDYGLWQDITSTIIKDTFTYVWDTALDQYEAGEHVLSIQASDDAGNTEEVYTIITLLDVTPPIINIETKSGSDTFYQGSDIELIGEVFDDGGIDRIELEIIGTGESKSQKITRGIKIEDGMWSYTWSATADLRPDVYVISAIAYDLYGNTDFDGITIKLMAKKTEKDEGKGIFGLPGFETSLLIIAFIGLIIIIKKTTLKD